MRKIKVMSEGTTSPAVEPSSPCINSSSRGLSLTGKEFWQISRTSLTDCVAFLFNNERLADVHFSVGKHNETKRIPAHRLILSMRSPVFDSMFNGPLAATEDDIEIADVDPEIFLHLLRYFYTDESDITSDTVMAILYAAKKYFVPKLENACVDYLVASVCSENAFHLLTQGKLIDESRLIDRCLRIIDTNPAKAFAGEGFLDIDLNLFCDILERNTMIVTEFKVFTAALRWAEAECKRQELPETDVNKRKVLGPALFLIRFPLIPQKLFAKEVAESGLLTDKEVIHLMKSYVLTSEVPTIFSSYPRGSVENLAVNRFSNISMGMDMWTYHHGRSDSISFEVDRLITFWGVGLYGSSAGPDSYSATVNLYPDDFGSPLGLCTRTYSTDGSKKIFPVLLNDPTTIEANRRYTLKVTIIGPKSFYGTGGVKTKSHEENVVFKFFTSSSASSDNNHTDVSRGQIPEIIFSL